MRDKNPILANKKIEKLIESGETLVDLLHYRVEKQGDDSLYTFLNNGNEPSSLTYDGLDIRAKAIGAYLQNFGSQGKHALLLYNPGLEFICAFWGCLYSNTVNIPMYPPPVFNSKRSLGRFWSIIEDAKPEFGLITSQLLARFRDAISDDPRYNAIHWIATDTITLDWADKWEPPIVSRNSLALLQYTSGSTAIPRGVMISHDNIMSNSSLIQECFGHTPASRGVIWLPPYHDMGLIGGIIQPLYVGFPVTLMSPLDFLQSPFNWLSAISKNRATTSGGPNFAYDLCVQRISAQQREQLDLSSWDVAFTGAESIKYETMEKFAREFKSSGFRAEAFYPCYGLAEATLIVSGGLKNQSVIIAEENNKDLFVEKANLHQSSYTSKVLVSCGRQLAGHKLLIVDPETRQKCHQGQSGEIWIAGPSVSNGYYKKDELTTITFNAYLNDDNNDGPFLRTGDTGVLQDGELFILGRIKDLIIIDGRNIYPQDIEWIVERDNQLIRTGGCAAFSIIVLDQERIVVAVEIDLRMLSRLLRENTGAESKKKDLVKNDRLNLLEFKKNIRRQISEQLDLSIYKVLVVKAGSLPRTSSGKIQRYLCSDLYLNGIMEEMETPNQ